MMTRDLVARPVTDSPPHGSRLWMYRTMVAARAFEDAIKPAYFEGKRPAFNMAKGPIPGEMHLSSGQEPCAVGVCAHLFPEDAVTATHRPHHIAIAKGVNLQAMAAEIFGRRNGLSGGRGGHMHLFDAAVNFCCSGIVAQGLGPAVGMALAAKLRQTSHVAVAFLGDGAANQGTFHESLNLAAVWKAPVIFVIEDNSWGISVAKRDCTAVTSNACRAAAYGMPGVHVADNNPDAVHYEAGIAIGRARNGDGPTLIEIETHRLEGHFLGDSEGYRSEGELGRLRQLDPIPAYRARMIGEGIAAAALDVLELEARAEIADAFALARSSPPPVAADAYCEVFAAERRA